jgi:hypothetical protein
MHGRLTSKHYALIAACLAGVGGMTSALTDWTQALHPAFIGGVLTVLGTQIGAIYAERP